jgi:hypothetical protein
VRPLTWGTLALVALVALAGASARPEPSAPPLLLALTAPGALQSRLVRWADGQLQEVATLPHVEDAQPRGVVLPGGRAAVVVERVAQRDPSWSAALWLASPAGVAVRADRVYPGTRPVPLGDDRVAVARGRVGPPPRPGEYRVDALEVDAVPLSGGEPVRLWEGEGFLALPVGATRDALLLYVPGPSASPLVAVDLRTRAHTSLAGDVPLARDFTLSPDGRRLYFTGHGGAGREDWRVLELELASGSLRPLAARPLVALLPFAAAPGVLVQWDRAGQARWLGTGEPPPVRCALGDGVDAFRAASRDGRWLAGLHDPGDDFARPVLLQVATGEVRALPVPAGLRPEVLGFVEGPP